MIQETNSLFLYHSCGPSLPLAEINNHGRFKLFSCTVFTTDNTAICTLKKVTIRQKRWKREEADKKKLTCKKIMQTRKREENKKKKNTDL